MSTAIVASARPDQNYVFLQSEILSSPLKDLPEISVTEMLFNPTSHLLTHGEAIAG